MAIGRRLPLPVVLLEGGLGDGDGPARPGRLGSNHFADARDDRAVVSVPLFTANRTAPGVSNWQQCGCGKAPRRFLCRDELWLVGRSEVEKNQRRVLGQLYCSDTVRRAADLLGREALATLQRGHHVIQQPGRPPAKRSP